MVKSSLLQALYQSQIIDFDRQSPFSEVIHAFLSKREGDLRHFDFKSLWRFPLTEEGIIESWRNLLIFALIAHLSKDNIDLLANTAHTFLNQPRNQKSCYQRLLVALNQFFADMPVQAIDLDILDGGAVLIALREYCPWQAQPYSPYHAEFGTLLCLLVHLTHNDDLKQKLLRMAKWHLNTLDFDFFPLVGLFSKEKNGTISQQIIWNYLFFYSLSHMIGAVEYIGVTKNYAQFIASIPIEKSIEMDPLCVLLEKMIEHCSKEVGEGDTILPHNIYDPSTALVGIRNEAYHSICTLHGAQTGLGCLRNKDVHILSYGPQYLPLEECEGFGIEGNYLSEHGIRQSWIDVHPGGFSLRGCARLVDQPIFSSDSLCRTKKLSGIWLEIEQEFHSSQLDLKTQFLGFDGWDSLAFSFFVKTKVCRVDSKRLIPRTLDCYDGKSQDIILEGDEKAIRLSSSYDGRMQIIPLSGGDNFWGADFLIAYMLDSNYRKYDWQMCLEDKSNPA